MGCGRCTYFCPARINYVENLRIILGYAEKSCPIKITEEIPKKGFAYGYKEEANGVEE